MVFNREVFWMQIYNLPWGCMSLEWGNKIGNLVGSAIKVDTEDDGIGWGRCLQVKVELPICTSPFPRAASSMSRSQNFGCIFRYEKLPKICIHCGQLLHREQGYLALRGDQKEQGAVEAQFGTWLRATSNVRRGTYSHRNGNGEGGKFSEKGGGQVDTETAESSVEKGWQEKNLGRGQSVLSVSHTQNQTAIKTGDRTGAVDKVQSQVESKVGMDVIVTMHLSNMGKKEIPKNVQEDFKREFTFELDEANGLNDGNGPKVATELCTIHLGPNDQCY